MPAVVKILIVFASMLALTRFKVPLGIALVLGGCTLSLWAGMSAVQTGMHLAQALTQTQLWLLVAITILIIEIGRHMTDGPNAARIVAATRRWGGRHGEAATLMALPAIIGLVPMPGGALFSAPFVQQSTDRMEAAPAWKSAVNYWFRHVWEYWWPLYPGVIVAMSLFEMDARQFIAAQIMFTPVAAGAGYLFLVRPHLAGLSKQRRPDDNGDRGALVLFLPLAAVIVGVFLAPLVLRRVAPDLQAQNVKLLSVLIGLLVAVCIILAQDVWTALTGSSAAERRRTFSGVFSRRSMGVLGALMGVLLFKFMLEASGLLPLAGTELSGSGIPIVFVVAALPFLAGLVTGLAVGFTGTAFPLVVGLLGAEGSGLTPLATLSLAYGFGYMGMMLSPVHLCLLMTKEYFSARLPGIYRAITPCVAVVLVYCMGAYGVFRALGW